MGIREHWDRVYVERGFDAVRWYQAEPRLSLELIEATGLDADARILDVGAGASRLVDRLLERGYRHPAVLDISERALNSVRERLGQDADRVEWFAADICRFRPPHRFELWHDRAVFHFLVDSRDRARYVRTLDATLVAGGHLVIATFGPTGPERCSGLPVVRYNEAGLASALGSEFELQETRDEVHRTPQGREQAFRYFRLRRAEPGGWGQRRPMTMR